jgi:tuftelin-interacting protein 11
MAKMDYKEGQGLGASGQGIVNPIQAQALKTKAGLGIASANEEKPRKQIEKRKIKSSTSRPIPRAPAKPKLVTTEARGLALPNTFNSIIIDATGKEARTLSSATGLMTREAARLRSLGMRWNKSILLVPVRKKGYQHSDSSQVACLLGGVVTTN